MKTTYHDLDNPVRARPGLLENCFRIPDDGLRLIRHRPGDQIALRIRWDLAREPDMAGSFNGLRLLYISIQFLPCTYIPRNVRSVKRLHGCLQGNIDNVSSAVVPDQEGEGESRWDLFMGNPMVGLDQREILDLAARLDVDSLMHTVGI